VADLAREASGPRRPSRSWLSNTLLREKSMELDRAHPRDEALCGDQASAPAVRLDLPCMHGPIQRSDGRRSITLPTELSARRPYGVSTSSMAVR
jgi:hypothetical protein